MKSSTLSFSDRATLCRHPLSKKLFSLMEEKESNLCLSADVTSAEQLLALADQLGPHIVVLKTHIDIISDFQPALPQKLRRLADRHRFLLFEDRKFADIGSTVALQYEHGLYRIVEWADIVNAHILPGPGIIEGLRCVGLSHGKGVLLLAEMSSKGSLAKGEYSQHALEIAERYSDFVMGFITQTRFSSNPAMVHLTPGIKLECGKDAFGQQYQSPDTVIGELGSDVAIVGRGILHAEHPEEMAEHYRKLCWEAYQQRMLDHKAPTACQ